MQRVKANRPPTLGDDLLWTVKEIARYLGITRRKAHHLIEKKGLPVRKLADRTIVARKSELDAWFSASREPRS